MTHQIPTDPVVEPDVDLFTFEDFVDYLLDRFDVSYTPRNLRQAKRAANDAYRRLPSKHNWPFYVRTGFLRTEAQFQGKLNYVHSSREATLTEGEWPEKAKFYTLILDNVVYPIEKRVSDTVVTLRKDFNPGEDLTDRDFTAFRAHYKLPVGFIRMSDPVEIPLNTNLWYVPPEDIVDSLRGQWNPQRPTRYTVYEPGEVFGVPLLRLIPPPSDVRTYHYMYEVRPQGFRIFRHTKGKVTASELSVTGTDTNFTSRMEGAVIRFSDTEEVPTGVEGYRSEEASEFEELDNPFQEQRVIVEVENSTTLTLDRELEGTYEDVGYSISDYVDVHPGSMWDYLRALGSLIFSEAIDSRRAGASIENEQRLLAEAMGASHPHKSWTSSGAGSRGFPSRLRDVAIIK